jgi:cell wall-associated NlpC family hydrolase
MRRDSLALIADEYARSFLGLPYLWGGDDPIAGFDCSGLCIEVLQGVGLFPHGADTTADGLWRKYLRVTVPRCGCLALFGSKERATHVAWVTRVYGEAVYIIEAGGGGSTTVDLAAAIKQNAYIRMRQIGGSGTRGDLLGYVDPFEV